MKLIYALIVILGLVSVGSAVPAKKRMVYYQEPRQWYSAPQRMMYVQYVQPSTTHARSAQAAEALVAGESVATGTYLKDCDHSETEISASGTSVNSASHNEQTLSSDAHVAQSVAEAYPEEPKPAVEAQSTVAEQEVLIRTDEEAKVPREYNFNNPPQTSRTDENGGQEPADASETDLASAAEVETPQEPAQGPVQTPARKTPVSFRPVNRYLPSNKKVYVELEQPEEEEVDSENETSASAPVQDADSEEDDIPAVPKNPARVPNARRPAAKKPLNPAKASNPAQRPTKPLPSGTFFPIDFGGTSGGAIAIANSFSTGEGGSATSHAIAYGSPEAVRARVRPSKYH